MAFFYFDIICVEQAYTFVNINKYIDNAKNRISGCA